MTSMKDTIRIMAIQTMLNIELASVIQYSDNISLFVMKSRARTKKVTSKMNNHLAISR